MRLCLPRGTKTYSPLNQRSFRVGLVGPWAMSVVRRPTAYARGSLRWPRRPHSVLPVASTGPGPPPTTLRMEQTGEMAACWKCHLRPLQSGRGLSTMLNGGPGCAQGAGPPAGLKSMAGLGFAPLTPDAPAGPDSDSTCCVNKALGRPRGGRRNPDGIHCMLTGHWYLMSLAVQPGRLRISRGT